MFSLLSRYRDNEERVMINKHGESVVYRSRRLLPRPEELQIIQTVTRDTEERIDTLSLRALGDSQQFWQLCDANVIMNPHELTAQPRVVVRVPAPTFTVTR
jgi:hypothetical protein